MEEEVTIGKNALAVLVSEAEQTIDSIDDPEWHETERISDAVEEAYDALDSTDKKYKDVEKDGSCW